MNLRTRLQQRLDHLGMSQKDLAKMIGSSQVSVHKILSGKTTNPGLILEIADAVKSDPRWLKFGATSHDKKETYAVNEERIKTKSVDKDAALEALTFIHEHYTVAVREEKGVIWLVDIFIKLYSASANNQLKNTDSELILSLIN